VTPTDDQLDAEIDAVAREMTAGVPADSSAFRRRVLDGIDTRSTPRRTLRTAWVVPPFAAAATIVIAVLVFRGGSDTTVRLKVASTDAQPRTTVRLPVRPSSVETERSGGGKPDTTDPQPRATVRLLARRRSAENLQRPSALAAVAPPPLAIAPIDVAPLGAAPLEAADSIQIPRLDAITPIDVTPLGLDDSQRRDE